MRVVAISVLLAAGALPAVASDLAQVRALLAEWRLDEAEARLLETLDDPALRGESLVLLTRVCNEREDFKRAVDYGKRAVRALPESSAAHHGRHVGRGLAARYQLARSRILGRYEPERAVEQLQIYIETRPDLAHGLPSVSSAWWRLGMAHEQLGQTERARQAYARALALDPGNTEARRALRELREG